MAQPHLSQDFSKVSGANEEAEFDLGTNRIAFTCENDHSNVNLGESTHNDRTVGAVPT
ncbi:hypothetical protein [Ralstonia pseudosolanacearum]|uniref:hypothetical protein n=1 Tax=Ralstonia pseudosolanacearum TaxID=1310165 RepID=UPI003CEA53F1